MLLNQLSDNKGATKSRIRVGRGIGSGKGKTGGRGVKGQKSRSGVSINGFEGGQMPLYRRLPKFGFNNPTRSDWSEVNLGRIQTAIDNGRLDASKLVDAEALIAAGVISAAKDGVRLLAKGSLSAKVEFAVAGASKSAQDQVAAAGGTVKLPEAKAPLKTGKRTLRREQAAKKRAARQS
ncbi:MAG: 50S ribosomal protein L15 [Alphaproteobacteria bacterium]